MNMFTTNQWLNINTLEVVVYVYNHNTKNQHIGYIKLIVNSFQVNVFFVLSL